MSVMLYYTNINSSTYLYMPTPMITRPTNNTLVIPDRNSGGYVWLNYWSMSCGYTGSNVVRQATNFWVTIWPPNSYPFYSWSYSSVGADADYVLLKFIPKYAIDPYNAVPITCSGCTYVEVFYATGIIRFRHSRTIVGGSAYNFTFSNFPSSAYSISSLPVYVNVEFYQNYRLYTYKNLTISGGRTVIKCTLFTFGVVSVSSLNGG
jgi:hypothetical protein